MLASVLSFKKPFDRHYTPHLSTNQFGARCIRSSLQVGKPRILYIRSSLKLQPQIKAQKRTNPMPGYFPGPLQQVGASVFTYPTCII